MKPTTLYIPLDADREVQIQLLIHETNGIDTDPGTHLRQPTIDEIFQILRTVNQARAIHFSTRPQLP